MLLTILLFGASIFAAIVLAFLFGHYKHDV